MYIVGPCSKPKVGYLKTKTLLCTIHNELIQSRPLESLQFTFFSASSVLLTILKIHYALTSLFRITVTVLGKTSMLGSVATNTSIEVVTEDLNGIIAVSASFLSTRRSRES